MKLFAKLSLRWKLVVLIGVMAEAVSLSLWLYLPARMEGFSRHWLERRGTSMSTLLSRSAASGIEFEDAASVHELLAGLSATPDVRYAVVRKASGAMFAAFHPELVPADPPQLGTDSRLTYAGGTLRVDTPIRARGGAAGTLTVGFALDELEQERRAQSTVVARASAAILLVGLGGAFLIGTVLVRPVQQMTEVALRIAAGDLSQKELPVGGRDEVAQMAAAFNRMLQSLRSLAAGATRIGAGDLSTRIDMEGEVAAAFNSMVEKQRSVLRQITEMSEQVASAAVEIYSVVQHQEGASSQQASGVDEVSRTVQSLLESASDIAESAQGVLGNAEKTKVNTEATSEKVVALSGHTNRIAELLEVIRDIADRSDLLALNASLEGTRAGEAGRAFSLVANEMRRLAERVTASVQDVKSLLADVSTFGTSSVMVADEGRKLADSTTESARQITQVTQQQRLATEQVMQSMRQIATLLAQTVASAQQTRSAVEVLKGLADRLAGMVGQFKVGERAEGLDVQRAA